MQEEELKQVLEKSFPESMIQVMDLSGQGDHFDLRISSVKFSGKSLMEQHRMVYDALGDLMKGPIHAVKINTFAE